MSGSFWTVLEQISYRTVTFLQQEVYLSLIMLPVVLLLAYVLRRRSPYLQYGLWMLLVLRLLLPTDLSLPFTTGKILAAVWPQFAQSLDVNQDMESATSRFSLQGNHGAPQASTPIFAEDPDSGWQINLSWHVWAFLLWLTGACLSTALFAGKWLRFHQIVRAADRVHDREMHSELATWCTRFRLHCRVELVSSNAFSSPFTIGWLRPKIFLPAALLAENQLENVPAVLAHELAHIKRRDVLWLRLQNVVQIVYFFYPLSWLINRQLNQSREQICDHMVLAENVLRPVQYAKSMIAVLRLNLNGLQAWQPVPAFGSDHFAFKNRIHKIFNTNTTQKRKAKTMFIFIFMIGYLVLPMAPGSAFQQEATSLIAGVTTQQQAETYQKPVNSNRVTSPFGKKTANSPFHRGMDFGAPLGADIYAFAGGVVDSAITEYVKNRGYGKKIVLTHADETQSVYAHLSEVLVEPGQEIKAGEVIGKVGSTGKSTGPHLHFEVLKNSKPVDPQNYFENQ